MNLSNDELLMIGLQNRKIAEELFSNEKILRQYMNCFTD